MVRNDNNTLNNLQCFYKHNVMSNFYGIMTRMKIWVIILSLK